MRKSAICLKNDKMKSFKDSFKTNKAKGAVKGLFFVITGKCYGAEDPNVFKTGR